MFFFFKQKTAYEMLRSLVGSEMCIRDRVIRFDYSGKVPGAKERAIKDCERVNNAISIRYKNLVDQGLLHTCSTIRDRDNIHSSQIIGMSLDKKTEEAH